MLSQAHKNEIKNAFDFFDVSGSGVIDSRNLKVVLRALGFESNIEETNKILKEIEEDVKQDNDGKIDFQTFLNVILYKMSEKETEENIQKAFELFVDKEYSEQISKGGEQKQVITKKSLQAVIKRLNEDIKEEEIEELIIRAINKNALQRCGEIG